MSFNAANPWNAEEYLKSPHTKQLLNLRDAIYRVSGINHYDIPESEAGYDITNNHQGAVVTLAQVKAELATRPHVPTKAEAKVIRQQRARQAR